MKTSLLVVVAVFVALTFAYAEDAVTVKGTVEVTKDAAGAVTAAKIVVKDGPTYVVAMDETGKAVVALAGKMVEATGTVVEKDNVKTITVTKVAEAK